MLLKPIPDTGLLQRLFIYSWVLLYVMNVEYLLHFMTWSAMLFVVLFLVLMFCI